MKLTEEQQGRRRGPVPESYVDLSMEQVMKLARDETHPAWCIAVPAKRRWRR